MEKLKKFEKPTKSTHFQEHLDTLTFFIDFSVYCDYFSPDFANAANLATSEPYSHDLSCISSLSGLSI